MNETRHRLRMARPLAQLKQGRADWYRIEAKAGEPTSVYIYDEVGYFGVTAADFVKEVSSIGNAIELHVNSPGGDVFDGIAIYNVLKNHPHGVTTYVDGLAASAASFIAMAGGQVVIERNAQMMIHEAHGLCIGNAADARELADLLDKSSDNIADIYAQKAGGIVEDWRAAMRAETWYSAQEAVDAGLADRVGSEPAETAQNTWDLSIFAYSGREAAPPPVPVAASIDPALIRAALLTLKTKETVL